MQRPERITLIAFTFFVIIGGGNAVAVRISNLELPPFWGAASRFTSAALIFWMIVFALRIGVPRGKSLVGAVLYGFFSIGLSYAFLYWGLLRVPASLTMVVMAFCPLITFFLTILHRLEKFRWRGFTGALIAILGIFIGVRGGVSSEIPLTSLLAIVAGTACIAEGSVLFKLFPKSDPVSTNAVAVSTGAAFLLALSLVAGETWHLPPTANTWAAYAYLVLIGSVVLFYLAIFILGRWTASATSYAFLLFPVSTVVIAAWLLGEAITVSFLFGGVLVLVGVWMGALSEPKGAMPVERAPLPEKATP